MARNVVPNTGVETIGTPDKRWSAIYADHVYSKDYADIKQFGAKGDGVTDDTEAIQKALNEVNNIQFTKGTYVISAPLQISKSNVSIKGDNDAVITYHGAGAGDLNNSDTNMFLIGTGSKPANTDTLSNITIDGLVINGDGQTYKGGESSTVDVDMTSPNPALRGIRVFRCVNIKGLAIKNCKITNVYGEGIICISCTNVRITDNYLRDCSSGKLQTGDGHDSYGDGITLFYSYDGIISGNTVLNTRTYKVHTTESGNYDDAYGKPCGRSGIEFEYLTSSSDAGAPDDDIFLKDYMSGALVMKNNFISGYTKGIHVESMQNANVDGNTVYSCHIGCMLSGSNHLVINNVFDSKNVGAAPQQGYNYQYAGICTTLQNGTDNTIIGNTFKGDSSGICIGSDSIMISSNKFSSTATTSAIKERQSGKKHISISNNLFEYEGNTDLNGIIALSNTTDIRICDNTFIPKNANTRCVYLFSGSTNAIIQGNSFHVPSTYNKELVYLSSGKYATVSNNTVYTESENQKATFISSYNSVGLNLISNRINNASVLCSETGSYFGVCTFLGNSGEIKATGYAPNTTLLRITPNSFIAGYCMKGEILKKLAGSNTTGDTSFTCTTEGFLINNEWSSSTYTTNTYITADGKVYKCLVSTSSASTIKPTHTNTSGSAETDGYTWAYIGTAAAFEAST